MQINHLYLSHRLSFEFTDCKDRNKNRTKSKFKPKSSFQQGELIANPYSQMDFYRIQLPNVEKLFHQQLLFIREQS